MRVGLPFPLGEHTYIGDAFGFWDLPGRQNFVVGIIAQHDCVSADAFVFDFKKSAGVEKVIAGSVAIANERGCFITGDQVSFNDGVVAVVAIPTVVEFGVNGFVSHAKSTATLHRHITALGKKSVVVAGDGNEVVFRIAAIQHVFVKMVGADIVPKLIAPHMKSQSTKIFGFGFPIITAGKGVEVHAAEKMSARKQLQR